MLDEQVVDFRVADEFLQEVIQEIPVGEVEKILAEVAEKSRKCQEYLSPAGLEKLAEQDLRNIFRMIFGVRKQADKILQDLGVERLKRIIRELLYSNSPVEERFTDFCAGFRGVSERGEEIDLAGELLHYIYPDQWWLWTRWVWNPRTQTGALRLLIADGMSLSGKTPGEVYRRVGEAVAYAEAAREAIGFLSQVRTDETTRRFLCDVYLACVYTLYMYAVLRMRMSKEFTKVVPAPAELVRRFLGTHAMGG